VIALVALALAADDEAGLSVHGDVKSFFTATFPYDHLLMPDAPSAQGVLDGRLKLEFRHRDLLRVTVHQTATALTAGSSSPLGTSTGVGLQAPEVVDLSWTAFSDDLELRGRIDRRPWPGPPTASRSRSAGSRSASGTPRSSRRSTWSTRSRRP
jgi:hypothetical protein